MSLGFPRQDNIEIVLHDILDVRSMVLTEVKDVIIETQFQGVEELTFTMLATDPRALYLLADGLIEYPEGRFWINSNYIDTNPQPTRTIKAKPRWQKLNWITRPGVFSLLARTPTQGFTQILAGSGWTLGDNPAADAELYSYEDIDASVIKLLRAWAAITGYELEFDTATLQVHVRVQVGEEKDLGFFYGSNLLNIERDFRPPEVTRMFPYGANNLSISAVNPSGQLYIENYDWYIDTYGITLAQARARFRKDYSWTDERFLQAVPLYDASVIYLEQLSKPQVAYKGKIIDLSRLTSSLTDDPQIGDWVWVHDEILGFRALTRVLRLVRHPLAPLEDEVELELFNNGLIDTIQNSKREIDYDTLQMIVHENESELTVGVSVNNYNTMALTSAGEATIAASSFFVGTGNGTGSVEIHFLLDGQPFGEAVVKDFVDGQQVEHSWTTFATSIPEGAHILNWSARIVSGSGTITLPIGAGRSVVWTKGAVGVGVNLSANQFISEVIDPVETLNYISSDEFTILLHTTAPDHILINEAETLTNPVLDEIQELLVFPFTIGDPVFGVIEGPGLIPGNY